MIFWILILCHLIADYPLQTDAMVNAKRRLSGLLMHVAIHFITIIVMFCGILSYDLSTGFILALAVSIFHLGIDHWKNILSKLRPDWKIFTYIQDQILHILSIVIVTSLWLHFSLSSEQPSGDVSHFIYASGFVLSTHAWFVTEKVFLNKYKSYQQWAINTMWPRMMNRAVIYSSIMIGFNYWLVLLLTGAILVVWYDLEEKIRYQIMALDLVGILILLALINWIAG
jgi:hypothetical protein